MTGVRYRYEVLLPIVWPYAGAVGENCMLMDDNALPHRAFVVNHFPEQECIIRMDRPVMSPDLNPMEHVRDMLQRAIFFG